MKTHKLRRREAAQRLLEARAKRSTEAQLKLLDSRPGESRKERERLAAGRDRRAK